ncbi:MAG TPA: site-specific DNA-methyltransferase, partial [Verrucomicrobiota bacterium]|nr:site-specific DNA-methyltransferase [Verrucomicrobiota bacterium]
YFATRRKTGQLDAVDEWIEMVSLNRLTGHSTGFFSVYTLPPNQATSVRAQQRINAKRNQTPPLRDVRKIILKKSKQLLGDCTVSCRATLREVAPRAQLLTAQAHDTPQIAGDSVALVVTSPPFLDVVQYATDNWLRCWFAGIDAQSVKLTTPSNLDTWKSAMTEVFHELHRVLRPGGHIAFEVGEVHGGKTRLEEHVLPCGVAAGLKPVLVLINDQEFTKTANCWGVNNMSKGTNTNRIVLFTKA